MDGWMNLWPFKSKPCYVLRLLSAVDETMEILALLTFDQM